MSMAGFVKMSVQVPASVRERFLDLGHGQKQLACTAGLLWYFAADDQTQFTYRTWAQSVADGHATMDEPPKMVQAALDEQRESERKTRPRAERGEKKRKA
jgi:hypothetical protein